MNKSIKSLACLAFFSLVVTGCENSSNGQNDGHIEPHVHNLEKEYRHDQKNHWHACIDEGYEYLKAMKANITLVIGKRINGSICTGMPKQRVEI